MSNNQTPDTKIAAVRRLTEEGWGTTDIAARVEVSLTVIKDIRANRGRYAKPEHIVAQRRSNCIECGCSFTHDVLECAPAFCSSSCRRDYWRVDDGLAGLWA